MLFIGKRRNINDYSSGKYQYGLSKQTQVNKVKAYAKESGKTEESIAKLYSAAKKTDYEAGSLIEVWMNECGLTKEEAKHFLTAYYYASNSEFK